MWEGWGAGWKIDTVWEEVVVVIGEVAVFEMLVFLSVGLKHELSIELFWPLVGSFQLFHPVTCKRSVFFSSCF